MRSRQEPGEMLRELGANFIEGVENDLRSTENSKNESHLQDHLDERMTPHLSIQNNIPMCQECGRGSSKYPRRLSADQMNDDCSSTSIAPKTSNRSKDGTLSDSQIAKSVLLNNVDFNRERTNNRNAPNNADFNRTRLPRKTTFVREIRWGSKIKSWKTIPRICESEF